MLTGDDARFHKHTWEAFMDQATYLLKERCTDKRCNKVRVRWAISQDKYLDFKRPK